MTERVNVSSQGRDEANGESTGVPSMSRDGDIIAFQSNATNLTPSSSPGVFVHERSSGTTEQIPDSGRSPSMSSNGRYVVFASAASEPGDGDLNAVDDVFVHDRDKGSVERVSISSDGSGANQGYSVSDASGRSISDNGRYVAFASLASNLVPNDTNTTIGVDGADVFVHDRKTHRTERASVGSAGEEVLPMWLADGEAVIDASGRFVAYSTSGAVAPEDEPDSYPLPDQNQVDVYVFDRATGSAEIVSLSSRGGQRSPCEDGSRRAMSPSLSRAAEQVAFESCSPGLVSGDGNSAYDIFVRDRGPLLGGGLAGSGAPSPQEDGEDDSICVTPDTCIPPNAAVSSSDATDDLNDVLTKQGANLYSASLAYRPQYSDLFAAIELEHMPTVVPGISPMFYGLRFQVEGRKYEVRATSLVYGTFGLFDCTDSRPLCTHVADLRGGYGTTGMRVVFSLPLEEIGLENGGDLKDVTAFSGIGSYLTGASKVLDRVVLSR
ncbi:MAG: TolB family protein [Actinomycetota bacterium]